MENVEIKIFIDDFGLIVCSQSAGVPGGGHNHRDGGADVPNLPKNGLHRLSKGCQGACQGGKEIKFATCKEVRAQNYTEDQERTYREKAQKGEEGEKEREEGKEEGEGGDPLGPGDDLLLLLDRLQLSDWSGRAQKTVQGKMNQCDEKLSSVELWHNSFVSTIIVVLYTLAATLSNCVKFAFSTHTGLMQWQPLKG